MSIIITGMLSQIENMRINRDLDLKPIFWIKIGEATLIDIRAASLSFFHLIKLLRSSVSSINHVLTWKDEYFYAAILLLAFSRSI